jgi:hypothetical protein
MNKHKKNTRVLGLTFPHFLCVIERLLNNVKVTVSKEDKTRNISHRQGRASVCSKDVFDAMQTADIICPCGS